MLAKTLRRQAQQIFKTLRVGLENCPENEMSFEPGGLGELAMHALGSVEHHFATGSAHHITKKKKTHLVSKAAQRA